MWHSVVDDRDLWLGRRSWHAEAGGWDMNRSIGHFVKGAVLKVYHMCIFNIIKYKSILRCRYYPNDIRKLMFMLDWYTIFGITMAFETLIKWSLWSSLLSRLRYSFSLGNGCSDAESTMLLYETYWDDSTISNIFPGLSRSILWHWYTHKNITK